MWPANTTRYALNMSPQSLSMVGVPQKVAILYKIDIIDITSARTGVSDAKI